MIVSFHPIISADKDLLCAGRDPGPPEAAAMAGAHAVILPQGCRKTLYEMAIRLCPHVFPDYRARFRYPDKIGQAALFAEHRLPFPRTRTFASLDAFFHENPKPAEGFDFDFPLVFKFNWGGEGESVFFLKTARDLDLLLNKAKEFERTGQRGFLLQEFVPTDGRSLRVAVIGNIRKAYWRVPADPAGFGTALCRGATIDHGADPDLKRKGMDLVNRLCEKTGLNLAGVDVIFRQAGGRTDPMLLETNYFFGRVGLGGSDNYYKMLTEAVDHWLSDRGLSRTGIR